MRNTIERIVNQCNSDILLKLVKHIKGSSSAPSSPSTIMGSPLIQNQSSVIDAFVIYSDADLINLNNVIQRIEVAEGACSDKDIKNLNLKRCTELISFVAHRNSLQFIKELKLVGFSRLETVKIESGCFSKAEQSKFELNSCLALKSVSIDNACFVDCVSVVFESEL